MNLLSSHARTCTCTYHYSYSHVHVIRDTRHTTPHSTATAATHAAQNSNEQQDEIRSENEKRSGCRLCVCTSTTLYWEDLNALPLMAAAASDASTAPVPLTFGPFEPGTYALPQGQRSAPHIFGRMWSPKFGFKTPFFKVPSRLKGVSDVPGPRGALLFGGPGAMLHRPGLRPRRCLPCFDPLASCRCHFFVSPPGRSTSA